MYSHSPLEGTPYKSPSSSLGKFTSRSRPMPAELLNGAIMRNRLANHRLGSAMGIMLFLRKVRASALP